MYNAIDPDEHGGDELDKPCFIVGSVSISGIDWFWETMWGRLCLLTKPWLMQFILALQSTDARVVMSFPWVFFKMVTVMLKHNDFLLATITHFTHLV